MGTSSYFELTDGVVVYKYAVNKKKNTSIYVY